VTGKTVVFFPEGAYGPTNNCVGIGDVLRERGHRVVFVLEESFAGTLEARGFEERLMRLGPAPEEPEVPGQFWKDFIRDTAPVFRKPTIEQLSDFIQPTFQALIDGSKYVDARLHEIFDELQPDVIVEDNVVAFPAVVSSGHPWVRIVSCNPLEVRDNAIAPVFSGLPEADQAQWDAFRAEYRRTHQDTWADFNDFVQGAGGPALPDLDFMYTSDELNLYLYPAEADYGRQKALDLSWHRLESCVRTTDASFELPAKLQGDGALVYLSLGSLGSADVGLMKRLVEVLGQTPHRYIVSKGPCHDEYELADNMWGEEFVPQPSILPMVDLVITHAGNNTTTECFHYGKPMIALPLFWDQYDNAQRVHETGFGVRLGTYTFDDAELAGAVDRLVGDTALRDRMGEISRRLQANPGTVKAAGLIEGVGANR
jgi:MGT family glycosyltransferase